MARPTGRPARVTERRFSAARMFDEIEGGPPRILTGVVTRHADDAPVIRFCKPVPGSQWLDIPETAVLDYRHLGHVPHEGVSLPLVELHLRPPESPIEIAFLQAAEGSLARVLVPDVPQPSPSGTYSNSKGPCIPLGNGQWWCPS